MLDLRRLRLLKELAERGTIAAVADALRFTPSAVSQQLAMLERETGVRLLERAGRGVRLTDPALVLVEHARALLDRAAEAEADLAAASGTVVGRARIAGFQSVSLTLGLPAMQRLRDTAPQLRCEFVEGEPEQAIPALALGDVDLVLGDEWQHQPRLLPPGLVRHDLLEDRVHICVAATHPRSAETDLAAYAREPFVAGTARLGWDQMTVRTCRELGGFEPDIRHRSDDAAIAIALVARGLAVGLLPQLILDPLPAGVLLHPIAAKRAIFAVTRAADASRPSTQAVLRAVEDLAAGLPHA